jgi:hypothetical protein
MSFVALAPLALGLCAQETIAQWNFNDETTNPIAGAGTAALVGGATATFAAGSNGDHLSASNKGWNIAGFPAQGESPRTAGIALRVNTAGYERVGLSFDLRFSSTASRTLVVCCSTDGTNFVDAAVLTAPADGWTNRVQIDLGATGSADNQPECVILLVSDFAEGTQYAAAKTGSSYSPTGTWRFDLVTITGTPAGGPANAPVINTQPRSLVGLVGGTARFSVAAAGSPPLDYQWYWQDQAVPGACASDLLLTNLAKAHEGTYHVRVSNAVGSVKSDLATLTVAVPLAIQFTNVLTHLVRPGDAPTNTFAEHAIRPGEQLTMTVLASDPAGGNVTLQPEVADLPPGATWTFDPRPGPAVSGTLRFTPTKAEAGAVCMFRLAVGGVSITNTAAWTVYVPNGLERDFVLTEYLANPISSPGAPHFNPLRRDLPASNPGIQDEYLELVNLSPGELDLGGWTIADAAQVRHRFPYPWVLTSSNAVVVYGGPLTNSLPSLDVACVPASGGNAGLALNNTGDVIIVRNASSNLVLRVVYTDRLVANDSSMTRHPDANGPFVASARIASLPVSPGRQYDGRPWNVPADTMSPLRGLTIAAAAEGGITLTWPTEADRTYSVLEATTPAGTYEPVATGLTTGQYREGPDAGAALRFYRIRTP